jgi:hypothetical protein
VPLAARFLMRKNEKNSGGRAIYNDERNVSRSSVAVSEDSLFYALPAQGLNGTAYAGVYQGVL